MRDTLDCFESVWKTVNDRYFDPSFGGLDWQAAHDRYHPQIAAAEDDETFYDLLNKMLWELEVSHIGALPPWWMLERWFSPHDFGQGSAGIDVRWLGDRAVVTSVIPGEPADRAGVPPGALLHALDGVSVKEIAGRAQIRPPYNDRSRRYQVATAILRHLYGPPGSQVTIAYGTDETNLYVESVQRVERQGGYTLYDGAPPAHLEIRSELLEDGIGYLYLSAFQWPLADLVRQAIDDLRAAPALVLDLRGNTGGDFDLFIGKFFETPVPCLSVQTRERTTEIVIEPEPDPYLGRVAVLVDEMTVSAAELFAASIQTTGRGIIVGDRSPGWVLGTESTMLPNGALFVYPNRQYRTPDGTVLEGRGLNPDVEGTLDRELLLQGIDSQLRSAAESVKTEPR